MRSRLGSVVLLSMLSLPAHAEPARDAPRPVPGAPLKARIERQVSGVLSTFSKSRDDATTWAAVRLRVGAVMQGFFLDGSLKGTKPEQAYSVKCGRDTMTETDILQGRLRVLVGYAPERPAQFEQLSFTQPIQPGA